MKRFLNILILTALFFGVVPVKTEGQQVSSFFIELRQQFSGPQKSFPGPNEEYEARLLGSSLNIDNANITWTHNGKVVLRGKGEKSYLFKTGQSGQKEFLSATATTQSGAQYKASKNFTINNVDLLWEARTTKPFWFKGKALATPRSVIFVKALPDLFRNGASIDPSLIVYEWSLDGKEETVRAGQNSFVFRAGEFPGTIHEVSLTAVGPIETTGAQKTITVPVAEPEIIFYEEHPLEGTKFSRAIETFSMPAGTEKKFRAEPYYFSEGNLDFSWTTDGRPVEEGDSQNILRIKAGLSASGSFSIETFVNNLENIFQEVRESFRLSII